MLIRLRNPALGDTQGNDQTSLVHISFELPEIRPKIITLLCLLSARLKMPQTITVFFFFFFFFVFLPFLGPLPRHMEGLVKGVQSEP